MTRLGYVVVELKKGTLEPGAGSCPFEWDGGELFDTPADAWEEANEAQEKIGADVFDYRVAEVVLV